MEQPQWRTGRAFASPKGYRRSITGWYCLKSLKQVVTASLQNARQQEWVSRILRDDHCKGLALVTGEVRYKPSLLKAHERRV